MTKIDIADIVIHKTTSHSRNYKNKYTYEWRGPEWGYVFVSGYFMRQLRHDWMKFLPWPMRVVSHSKERDQWILCREVDE